MNKPLEATQLSTDLLAELEESMPQGVPNDTGLRRRADDVPDELDVLDQLLAESTASRDQEEQYKADRKSAAKGFSGMSAEEIAYCNSRMKAFEMAKVWDAQWAIEIWNIYECQNEVCYAQPRMVFSRYMEFHQHRHQPKTHRFVTVKETQFEATPVKEVRYVPVCPRCSQWQLDPRGLEDLTEVLK